MTARSTRDVTTTLGLLLVVALVSACSFGAVPTSVGSTGSLVTAKPADTEPPRVKAIEAFVANVTSGTFTYRVAFHGIVAASADRGPLSGRMDVSGADFATTMDYDFSRDYGADGKYRVLARAVKGKAWQRQSGGKWTAIKGYGIEDSNAPFASVRSRANVKDLGDEEHKGKTVRRISIQGAVLIHPRTIEGLVKNEKIRATTLEVLIDGKGRPVRGTWTLKGQARVGNSGQLQEVIYDLTLAFSKVGAKLTIERP